MYSQRDPSNFGNPGVGIGQFIAFTICLNSFYMGKLMFDFDVGGSVYHYGNAKILAKQNSGRFVEILDCAIFDAPHHTECNFVIIGITPCHQKLD